jgi:hypothetical protein
MGILSFDNSFFIKSERKVKKSRNISKTKAKKHLLSQVLFSGSPERAPRVFGHRTHAKRLLRSRKYFLRK